MWRSITQVEPKARYRYAVSGALKKAGVAVHNWHRMYTIFQASRTPKQLLEFLHEHKLTTQGRGAQCIHIKLRLVFDVLKAAHEALGEQQSQDAQESDPEFASQSDSHADSQPQSPPDPELQSEQSALETKRLRDESKLVMNVCVLHAHLMHTLCVRCVVDRLQTEVDDAKKESRDESKL